MEPKGQNCFGPNYLYEIGLKRRRHAGGRRCAAPVERAFVRRSESAPRDPLFPVNIITGNSVSFKIKHLAFAEGLGPRKTLHLVIDPVRGPVATGHGPRAGAQGRAKCIQGLTSRLPFPSLRTGRSRHVLSEAVGRQGLILKRLRRALRL